MRLIDADAFIEYLGLDAENAREDNVGEIVTLEYFDRQPTAFDKEKVIEEIQQYREIGTVEECREAVEKQKQKKPKELDAEYGYFICGNCGGAIAYTDDFKSHKYCLNCGQKIDFGGNGR